MIKRAAGDEGSGDGGRVANTASSGSELSRPSSTNQNSKPRNKSLTIRPATVCRRTELMIEKRARRRRFSLRGDFFPPGADFGASVSARGNPVSRKASARAADGLRRPWPCGK